MPPPEPRYGNTTRRDAPGGGYDAVALGGGGGYEAAEAGYGQGGLGAPPMYGLAEASRRSEESGLTVFQEFGERDNENIPLTSPRPPSYNEEEEEERLNGYFADERTVAGSLVSHESSDSESERGTLDPSEVGSDPRAYLRHSLSVEVEEMGGVGEVYEAGRLLGRVGSAASVHAPPPASSTISTN